MRLTAITILTAALFLTCVPARAAGSSGFGLEVIVNDTSRAEYQHAGRIYIEAIHDQSYSLKLTNPTPYRVAVALSVDGLNTIDAKHTDARSAAKWILEPYGSTTITGWQVSSRDARRFFFTGEKHSYGAALGQTDNLGVIEAVFYREVQPAVAERSWTEVSASSSPRGALRPEPRKDSGNSAGMPPPPPAASSQPSDDYAATGMGRRTRHEVESIDMNLEPSAVASIRLHYEFRPQLVRLGILPGQLDPAERRERASGFATWCPEVK